MSAVKGQESRISLGDYEHELLATSWETKGKYNQENLPVVQSPAY